MYKHTLTMDLKLVTIFIFFETDNAIIPFLRPCLLQGTTCLAQIAFKLLVVSKMIKLTSGYLVFEQNGNINLHKNKMKKPSVFRLLALIKRLFRICNIHRHLYLHLQHDVCTFYFKHFAAAWKAFNEKQHMPKKRCFTLRLAYTPTHSAESLY